MMPQETKCAICEKPFVEGDKRWAIPDPDDRIVMPEYKGNPLIACRKCYEQMKNDDPLKELRPNRFSDLQNQLSAEENRVIKELRKIDWGKLTVIKKGGAITVITPAPDIRMDVKPR
jgi:hypothetical protein